MRDFCLLMEGAKESGVSIPYILILIPHNLSAEWLPGVLVDTVGAPHHLAPGRGDGRGVECGQPLHHLLHLRQHLVYWPHCTHVRCITGFCPRYIDPALLTMVLQFQAADCTTVRRWVDRIESVWLNPCRVKTWSPFCVSLINYLCPHSGFVNHLSEAINYVRAEFSQFSLSLWLGVFCVAKFEFWPRSTQISLAMFASAAWKVISPRLIFARSQSLFVKEFWKQCSVQWFTRWHLFSCFLISA